MCIRRNTTFRYKRRYKPSGKRGPVTVGHCLPRPKLIFLQRPQLGQKDGGLDRIQPRIHPDPYIAILAARPFPMHAKGTQKPVQRIIIYENCPAVPIASQRLRRKKGCRRDHTERTTPFPPVRRAETLCSILNQRKAVFFANGQEIFLSVNEQRLLRLLVDNPGRILTREVLVDRIWGDGEYVDENALSVTVRRLRAKLEDEGTHGSCIQTVYGQGYMWKNG